MTAMYLLIAFSLVIATGFVLAFVWAIRSGQYDDKYTPSVRVLFDDERPVPNNKDQKLESLPDKRMLKSDLNQTKKTSTQTTN